MHLVDERLTTEHNLQKRLKRTTQQDVWRILYLAPTVYLPSHARSDLSASQRRGRKRERLTNNRWIISLRDAAPSRSTNEGSDRGSIFRRERPCDVVRDRPTELEEAHSEMLALHRG